jgi:site-specific DNA-methyltransferase (adenine-specific)
MTTESGIAHPAPFPVELPRRLILLYTQPGDLVLDPFMGAGATAVAAVQTGRQYAGYDVSEEYCALARKRVEASRQVDK